MVQFHRLGGKLEDTKLRSQETLAWHNFVQIQILSHKFEVSDINSRWENYSKKTLTLLVQPNYPGRGGEAASPNAIPP